MTPPCHYETTLIAPLLPPVCFSLLILLLFHPGSTISRVTESDDNFLLMDNHQYAAALVNDLIGRQSSYNRTVIPPARCSSSNLSKSHRKNCPFIVHCRLYLIRVQEIRENDETIIITARLQLGWNDSALRWDPAKYGGLKEVILPPRSIWLPSLQVANSAEDVINPFNSENYWFRVTNEGRIWYHPSGRFATRCGLDLTYYPFDYQRCALIVESTIYTYNELLIGIRPNKPEAVSRGMFAENPMWHLTDTNGWASIYKSGRNTGFSRVQFWFTLKRKPDYYQRTFLIPLGLLSVLQVLTYAMPMKFVDRVPQASVVLMTTFFLQGYIADQLPQSSADSLVQTYLNVLIAMSVMTAFFCTLTIELIDPDDDLPLWGLWFLRRYKNRFLQLFARRRNKQPQNQVVKTSAVATAGTSDDKSDQSASPCLISVDRKAAAQLIKGPAATAALNLPEKNYNKRHDSSVCSNNNNKKRRFMELRRSTMIAAAINLVGFLLTSAMAVFYPLFAFVILVGEPPPPLAQTAVENATIASYYGD